MANKTDKATYLTTLQMVIRDLHGCGSTYLETVPVHETWQGKTVWQGEVEVFELKGHPKATHCYAWSHLDGPNDEEERFVAVLNIPPATTPANAVKAAIVADAKKRSAK